MAVDVCPDGDQRQCLSKRETGLAHVRFFVDVPSPTDEISVLVDAVSAEWETTSVD
jgi:hypothetical protein